MNSTTPITVAAAGYRSLDRAVGDYLAVWAARREGTFHHSALALVAQEDGGRFRIERDDSTAKYLTWGDGLLDGALSVLLPRVSVWLLPQGEVDGRGAVIRHFHRNFGLDDLVAAAGLLEDHPFGLAVVVVNRGTPAVAPLLAQAERAHAMTTVWGDLEEELSRELVRPRLSLALATG